MLATLVRAVRSLPDRMGRADTRSYMPELDGLRCLAVAFVLLWHAALRAVRAIHHAREAGASIGDWYDYVPHGEIGVILFFFISGFVVSRPFLQRPRDAWDIGAFYKRRFVRIYPPYLVALTACFLVLGVAGHVPNDAEAYAHSAIPLTQSFLASLVYLHGVIFDAPSRLDPPTWSLEIEVAFYAILPPLMLLYTGATRGVRMAVTAGVVGVGVVASSLLVASLDIDLRLRWGLFYHAYLFLLGILAADWVGARSPSAARKGPVGDVAFVAALALLAGIGLAMTHYDARMPNSLYALVIQAATILALVLVFHGAFHGRRASAWLSLPWIRLVGTMCYSIYLTHIVVMTAAAEVIGHVFHPHQTWLVYLVYVGLLVPASLLASLAFYVAVERPFARHLAGRKRVALPLVEATLRS